jgi:Flp pilus assembly protein TadG
MHGGARCQIGAGRELPQALRPHRRRREEGQALVEFALILPVLALILFGIIDFARALDYYNSLTQLAGQGARAAAVYQNPNGGTVTANSIQCQLIQSYTSNSELKDGISISVTPPPTPAVGEPVVVRAQYDFDFIPLIKAVIPTSILNAVGKLTLTATSAHRAEVVPAVNGAPVYAPSGSATSSLCGP